MSNNLNREDYIPLDNAKNLIIAALYQYHPELADRAADILEREGHTIIDNPERVTGMQQCRPRHAEVITDENHPMYMSREDFDKRFAPNFTEMGNPRDHAVIDFEYLGTPNSVLVLAHEIGHAIAADIQKDKHLTHKNFTLDQQEEQAYFVQSIMSHYAGIPSPEALASDDLKIQFEKSDRSDQFRAANNRFNDSLSMNLDQRYEQMVMALAGNFDHEGAHQQTLTTSLSFPVP